MRSTRPSTPEALLREAARAGKSERVRRKLREHANAREPDQWGRSPLMLAAEAQNNSEACVAILLPMSDPREVDLSGESALMKAARHGNLGAARLLMPVSDLGLARPDGERAQSLARKNGHERCAEEIEALLEARALAKELPIAAPGVLGKVAL